MKKLKNRVAIFLSILTLMQSCAVYQGNYSLKTAVDNGKKVKVKTQYNEFLLFSGNRYKYNRLNDHHSWSVTWNKDSSVKQSELRDSISSILPKIILFEDSYYAYKDFENRNSWVKISPSAIVEVSKTKRQQFKRLVYQEGHYWGITDENEYMNLVPVHENQVNKVSQYNPVISVLGSILITPLVIGILLLTPVEDDW